MKNTIKWMAALLLLFIPACGDSPLEPEQAQIPDRIMLNSSIASFHSLSQVREVGVTVLDREGEVVTNPQLEWTLEGEGVVEMASSGVFRSVANGEARVTVRVPETESSVGEYGYRSGLVERTLQLVVDQRPAALQFSGQGQAGGDPVRVEWLGGFLDLDAHLVDANGYPITGSMPEIRWDIGDSDVLRRTEDGRIVPVGSGVTNVQVRAGTWSTTLPVEVDATIEMDWCARYHVPRPDAPADGIEACSPTTMIFAYEEDR